MQAGINGDVDDGAEEEEEGPWVALEERVTVRGSYGSKVEAIVRRVLAVLQGDATAKVGHPSLRQA